jgi:cytochrome c oxidase subunit 2
MLRNLPLFPPSASSVASEVDLLFLFLVAVSVFFVVLIAALVVVFAVAYRRRHAAEVGHDIHGSLVLELTWTVIPLGLTLVMFAWGASLFFRIARPPSDAMDVYVVGKQWMWKIQHPSGVREINELHVPVGRPVRLTLGSEDVIHDFSIPAFRVKMDVVPGRLTTLWFTATEVGTYHLFCSQYCGTKHSGMIGQVIAMTPQDYEEWLTAGRPIATAVDTGERLFADFQCSTCHKADGSGRGPSLVGLFGSRVTLADGRTVIADDNYVRESIMSSQAKVVRGFQPIMPAFQGQITEENLLQIMAYIKTLQAPAPKPPAAIK